MDAVELLVGLIVGIAAGVWGGFVAGERWCRSQPGWRYWLLNVAVVLIGVFGYFGASLLGWLWLTAFSLSVVAGSLTGLKYGYGKSVGLWRVHDRMMRSDELLRDSDEDAP